MPMLFPGRIAGLVLLAILAPASSTGQQSSPATNSEPNFYRNAHPYLDQSVEQLTKHIPELKGLEPVSDQQILPTILAQTAVKVDLYLDSTVDLFAREEVTRARLRSNGTVQASQNLQYNYLIVHHDEGLTSTIEEYRTDLHGNRVDQAGLDQSYSLTSGFALIGIHFASDHKSESTFRYLGQQTIASRNTYVVAFAQLPDRATPVNTVQGTWGSLGILVQGIAWIDETSYEIIRMRTDLLAPVPQIGLDQQTTEVSFDEVRLRDVPDPLWLPNYVRVDAQFQGTKFRNEHRYADFRRYRVSSKMLAPN
jgi:hypothetical protein